MSLLSRAHEQHLVTSIKNQRLHLGVCRLDTVDIKATCSQPKGQKDCEIELLNVPEHPQDSQSQECHKCLPLVWICFYWIQPQSSNMMFICLIDDTIGLCLPSSYTWKPQIVNKQCEPTLKQRENYLQFPCTFSSYFYYKNNKHNIEWALYINKLPHLSLLYLFPTVLTPLFLYPSLVLTYNHTTIYSMHHACYST